MAIIAWDEKSMGTGVESVDREHQSLIKMLNELMEATSQGKGKEEIGRMMDFLGKYAVNHFQSEEGIMDECQCPTAAQNKQDHAKFLSEYQELSRKFETDGPSLTFVIQVQKKVANWLISHIRGCDMALKKCQMAEKS